MPWEVDFALPCFREGQGEAQKNQVIYLKSEGGQLGFAPRLVLPVGPSTFYHTLWLNGSEIKEGLSVKLADLEMTVVCKLVFI